MDAVILIIEYLVTVINILLGLVIFSRGFKNIPDVLFGMIAFTSAIWSASILFFYLSLGESIPFIHEIPREVWIIVSHLTALAIPVLSLLFSTYFPNKIKIPSYIKVVGLLPAMYLAFELLSGNSLIVGSVDGFSYELGSIYWLYSLVVSLYFLLNYVSLYYQYSRSSVLTEKKQVAYILYGTIISSSLAIVPDLILPYFNIFSYTWLGPIFTIIFVITIFITILKFKLFKIKVIVTELFAGLIILMLLTEILYSSSATELVLKTAVIILVVISSFLLTRSVYREIDSREEIERLARDLTEANARLKEVDKMKTEFLSLATHQIRSPLTAIKGYASLIMEGSFGKPPESIYGAVEKIFQSSQSLVIMVEDFLNISRIEQGRMKYEFATHDLFDLVQKVVGELKPTLDKANLKYSITTDGEPHYFSRVDIGKMQQVFSNLIDNAIKYTPPPGSITISIYKNPKRHTIIVDVKDTGVGIDQETIGKLFKKFTRADDANKVNVIGTGLGLYIAKQMVEGMHGILTVHSEGKGKGSTFSVEMTEDVQAVHAHDINNFANSL